MYNIEIFKEVIAWIAIFLLSFGYSYQAYKVYKTGQTKGLSFLGYFSLCLGFITLFFISLEEATFKFSAKQIMALIPVALTTIKIWIEENRKEKTILLIDDDFEIHRVFQIFLKYTNVNVFCCYNKKEASMLLKNYKFDVIFVDLHLGEELGIELIEEFKEINPELNFVLISSDTNLVESSHELKFVEKPVSKQKILKNIYN